MVTHIYRARITIAWPLQHEAGWAMHLAYLREFRKYRVFTNFSGKNRSGTTGFIHQSRPSPTHLLTTQARKADSSIVACIRETIRGGSSKLRS